VIDYYSVVNAPLNMDVSEKMLLALVASSLPERSTIVEVGTAFGGSARLMAAAAPHSMLHTIDVRTLCSHVFEGLTNVQFFHGNTKEFALRFPDIQIQFLYIDADHSFSGALNDYMNMVDNLPDGALVGFHDVDFGHYGVKLLCDTLLANGNLYDAVQVDKLLVAHHNKSRKLPEAGMFAESIAQHGEIYRHHQLIEELDNFESPLADMFFDPVRRNGKIFYIGRGSFGAFIQRHFDISAGCFIDSNRAVDPTAQYIVCSSSHNEILHMLTNEKQIPLSHVHLLSNSIISWWVLQDALYNHAARILKHAQNDIEREILKSTFLFASQFMIYAWHKNGFLTQFFTKFWYSL